jgi:predicted lipoprotein
MSDLITQIAVLETQMKQIAKQVDEGFSNNSKEHKEIVAMFQKAIDLKADRKDVDALVDNQKWIVRLVVGAVATAVIGLIVKINI